MPLLEKVSILSFFSLSENVHWYDYLNDVLDIVVVTYVIYKLMMIVRGTKAVQLIKGISIILVSWFLSGFFGLKTLQFLLNQVITYGLLGIIIIFQPELRRGLEHLGRTSNLFGRTSTSDEDKQRQMIEAIVSSAQYMSKRRIGALIAIERDTGLNEYVETGIRMDSHITSQLIINLFIPNTPLHDGAMIIQDGKIAAAACYLPLSESPHIDKALGTRHRAAIGVSEVTDSVTLTVSEETGAVSLAIAGRLYRELDEEALRNKLIQELVIEEKETTLSFFNKKGGDK
ncbi:TIGR00159 family protein [Exiguobacterium sp. SH3S2]|uniref:diadenylate cyclase CdaA n=1 Tax=Exiguobacterium TaxID=33986 RepID=UPI0003529969|nr:MULTISPECIES: diadenylate cyclase CdaA [Exiguobacterium]EPE62486.1 disA bacterial checkpoint controller nucleotide-binding family protein [Exiguobacterium sp. S17]TCI57824.1 TIGR00159 family protein [Exiguobacterium sp. SH1S21]TCI58995.1 TIGR00159 family protein [Exiguobacterium sp. SH3S2]OGX79365.1 TIGR00159 family protein [Exiguobacterium sp. SH31]TCI26354.1 TIGR00159 family protein [Exiguobacterium sp. SH5S4]